MAAYLGKAECYALFKLSQVREILWSGDGAFVLNEMLLAQDENPNAIDLGRDLSGEGVVVVHAGETGQKVDAIRRAAELNDLIIFGEINRREF